MDSLDPVLYVVMAAALVAGVAVPWAWDRYRGRARQRAAEAARAQERHRADRWWRQHSLSTMPHSRFVLDEKTD